MATFWFETCVEGYFWWKLPVGRQFKSLEEYSPLVPGDPEKLTIDFLNIAEMYLLDHLKEACLRNLVEKLEVSSCITTYIMVADRYLPSDSSGNLRELVIKFMRCKAEEVVETDNWDKLMDNHPSLAKELVRAIVKGVRKITSANSVLFCIISKYL
jgi:hypothetical protein